MELFGLILVVAGLLAVWWGLWRIRRGWRRWWAERKAWLTPGPVDIGRERQPDERRARIPTHVRRNVFRRDGWRCRHCNVRCTTSRRKARRPDWGYAHLDHIRPWSKRGSDSPQNLQLLCRACNLSKSNRFVG